MALNPETVQFLYNQILNASYNTLRGSTSQLFDYLETEIKDNPIFDKYKSERKKWENWPGAIATQTGRWTLPSKLEDAKSLAFDIYQTISEHEDFGGLLQLFSGNTYDQGISELNQSFSGYLAKTIDDILNANPESDTAPPKKIKGNTVFIIHGHDNELKVQLQLLLKTAGVNNFVLHEQADKGRTIIEKLIQETETSGYAIALLTPDDLVENGNNRARQNVILELGYFLGKIGKERIRIIVRDNVEIPSDLQGILYEKYDSAGAWKMKLLKEIQAVGIYVDLNAVVSSF